ncbi:MAG: hypothetical protein ACI4IG_06760 [Eubacterium sp.]
MFDQILTLQFFISSVLSVLVSVFVMLAVGYDCRAEGIKNRTLWMVICFFSPKLGGIIYLICRKKAERITPKYCPLCGVTNAPNVPYCLQCGNMFMQNYKVVGGEKKKKISKVFLTLAIIAMIAETIYSAVSPAYDYSEFFDDGFGYSYGENYGDRSKNNSNDFDKGYFDDFSID